MFNGDVCCNRNGKVGRQSVTCGTRSGVTWVELTFDLSGEMSKNSGNNRVEAGKQAGRLKRGKDGRCSEPGFDPIIQSRTLIEE